MQTLSPYLSPKYCFCIVIQIWNAEFAFARWCPVKVQCVVGFHRSLHNPTKYLNQKQASQYFHGTLTVLVSY